MSVNNMNFVIFDGSSHYVVDYQDMEKLTSSDQSNKVVFKHLDLDRCQDFADELNEEI